MQPDSKTVDEIITRALAEDVGAGDVTSQILIPEERQATLVFVNREPVVICGVNIVEYAFKKIDESIEIKLLFKDGSHADPQTKLIEVSGSARAILTGERVALNLFQRMSSVATTTAKYVDAVKGTKARILDTRKTMPGLRALDKYAVLVGGGHNHRFGLYDMILIKDNHIAICGGVKNAIQAAKNNNKQNLIIEIECDTLGQVQEAIEAGAERILLDNMSNDMLRQAVAMAHGRAQLEASGNVNMATVRGIAETGVDDISVGRLTHSVQAIDIGLDIHM